MWKIRNVIKIIEFTDADDLHYELERFMCADGELNGDRRCYHVQSLELLDKAHALLCLEEDNSVVQVKFNYNGEMIGLLENSYYESFLSYQEIQLMNELGIVELEDTEYAIEEIKYCIRKSGMRYVQITLN